MPRGRKKKSSKNGSSIVGESSEQQSSNKSASSSREISPPELSQPVIITTNPSPSLEQEMSPEGTSQPLPFRSNAATPSKSSNNTPKKSPARTTETLQTQATEEDQQMVPESEEEDNRDTHKRARPSSFKQFFDSDDSDAEESSSEENQSTPKKKKASYLSTPSSYRIPSREGDETSERIVTPPSDRKRAKNFTQEEDRRIFRLVRDIYDGEIPPVVDKEVFTILSNILKDRSGQSSGISRRFYRTAKFEFTPKDIDEHEEEDNAYFRPYQEFIFSLKEKIAKEVEEAESKKRTKHLGELEKFEEQPEPPKSTPKKSTPKKASTPKKSTPSKEASSSSTPTVQDDEETTKAQKLVSDLKSISSKPTEYVTHALYSCSGNAKLAARLLDDNIVLTEDDKRNIWTQKEDNILLMKIGGKELQTLVEYKGRHLVEARIAWLEVQDYDH